MLYIIFLSLLLICTNEIQAMEDSYKEVVIQDVNDQIFNISSNIVGYYSVIRKWNEESVDIIDDDNRVFTLRNAPFFTRENIEFLSTLINHKMIKQCPHNKVKDIFLIADALQANEKILKKLSKKAWKTVSLEEITQEMPSIYTYLTSINDLPETSGKRLYFVSKKLCYLKGIKSLSNPETTYISLHNNQLRFINIIKLLKLFPALLELDLSFNDIEHVKLPYCLPDFFILNLAHNKLVTVPIFKVQEGSVVDLRKNPLSGPSKALALNALPGSYMKYVKISFRRIFCSFSLSAYLFSLFSAESSLGVMGSLVAWLKARPTRVVDGGWYKPIYTLKISYMPVQDILDYFRPLSSAFKWELVPNGVQWVDNYVEKPSDTNFFVEVKKLVASKYLLYGTCVSLAGAWLISDYYFHNTQRKKYNESKIIL